MREQTIALTKARFGYLLSYESDQIIGNLIRTRGEFEEGEIGHAIRLLNGLGRQVSLKTFVDVGANIGTHTVWALANGFEDAICIEPDEANFKLLRANQILNDIGDKCRNVKAAASTADGSGFLELSDTNFGDHRVKAIPEPGSSEDYSESTRQIEPIATKRLDTIFHELQVDLSQVGLVWIDTQGHEGQVLAGASSLRTAGSIPWVCEFWPYALKRSAGYRLFRDAVVSSGRKIYDLKKSIAMDELSSLPLEQMDAYYETAKTREFTDLVLL